MSNTVLRSVASVCTPLLILAGSLSLAAPASAAAPTPVTTETLAELALDALEDPAAQTPDVASAAKRRPHARAPRPARVLHLAATRRGDPYRYGATGPQAFDCSGFTSWVFAHVGEHLPRTSAAQAHATRRISRAAARPGDLVFFTSGGRVYHVGILASRHSIWHAPYAGQSVRRERIWTSSYFVGRVR